MNLRLLFVTIILTISFLAHGQNADENYFQQTVNSVIDVSLDDVKHEITGTIKIDYTNNSGETLDKIYMHLWGNAYKDQSTAFAKQQLRNKSTKFYYSSPEEKG
ncbi:hypothetical protein N9B82_04470, partial [Saprospiraceae bacterium]|nr:hypothetical protein [Saprospiraceae bacterium]